LPLVLMELISDESERRAMGRRALDTLHEQAGATTKTLAALEPLLPLTRRDAVASTGSS
jgi:hypothetical protein